MSAGLHAVPIDAHAALSMRAVWYEQRLSARLSLPTGQVHPIAHVIMNRTNARISLEKLEIRGEDGDKQVTLSPPTSVPRDAGLKHMPGIWMCTLDHGHRAGRRRFCWTMATTPSSTRSTSLGAPVRVLTNQLEDSS